MLRHRHIERICCIALAATILLTCAFMGAAESGLIAADSGIGYEARLFDQTRVHTIDIVMQDWEGFLETCTNEEYAACTVVIDGENYGNVAIRAKGNTSLSSVASYGTDRYSFKIEFDHYESGKNYYGLDKLSLNNLIQDSTLMKDYLAYTLMNRAGVASPLCSFAQVNVNGEAWGLYLAVEAVEDGFLIRNYGDDHGELYKPDSMSFGGGRGNGRDFDMDAFAEMFEGEESREAGNGSRSAAAMFGGMQAPGGTDAPDAERDAQADASGWNRSGKTDRDFMAGGFVGGRGSSDVMLQYIDEDPESYPNIFESAKTDVSDEDKARLIEALRKLSEGESIAETLNAVDADAMIRYLTVHSFMVNGDSYTGSMIHNYYLYEEDGRLSMLPWDYNLAFGAFSMGGGMSFGGSGATSAVNSPIDTPVTSGDISTRPIISWIFESEEYTQRYHEIYGEWIEAIYDSGWLMDEIARFTEMIAPYVEADENGFTAYEDFIKAAETLAEFCRLRCESIKGQLDGSVPSTSEGQSADSGALIDASHVSLNDMGGMGSGKVGRQDAMIGQDGFNLPNVGRTNRGFSWPLTGDAAGGGGGSLTDMPEGMNVPESFNPSDMDRVFGGQAFGKSDTGRTASEAADAEAVAEPENEELQETILSEFGNTFGDGRNMPQTHGGSLERSGMDGSSDGAHWMMLAICAAVLLAGIATVRWSRSGR